jgi:6-phosphogluconolactonase/glucosamine-6-phosphate isomerase/deaminase
MKYVHITSTKPVIEYLSKAIIDKLGDERKVLWLLSGGSSGEVCVDVSKRLRSKNLENLYVTMTDERFGLVGHADENWQKLLDDGLDLPGAKLYRPLIGLDRASTTIQFAYWLENTFEDVDYTIGVYGVGTDGHTAGLKPVQSAIDADGWATDFDGHDFERITMTFSAISQLDEAILQAMGKDKATVLDDFMNKDIDPKTQPVQILKTVPKLTVFTDYQDRGGKE